MSNEPGYYSLLTAKVRYDKNLKPMEKILYSEITAFTNANKECFASNSYFANLYDVSKETISRWLSNLQKRGYLKIIITRNEKKKIIKRVIIPIDCNNEKTNDPIDKKINTLLTKKSIGIDEKVKGSINNNSIINYSNNTYEQIAEELYKKYPRKKGKKQGIKKTIKYLKDNTYTKEQILNAINNYKQEINKNNTEEKYIKHFSTFINNIEDYNMKEIKETKKEVKKVKFDESMF